jgi:hypothetical protein
MAIFEMQIGIFALLLALSAAAGPSPALIEAPIGGRPISVPGGVVCPPLGEWTLTGEGRIVPPTSPAAVGLKTTINVAATPGEVTQSSVSVHAWVMREFRNDACTSSALSPGAPGCSLASRWAFVFGPSISIGDLGANL